MSLKKINSNSKYPELDQFASKHVFKQKQRSINPFFQKHNAIRQKQQVITQIFKQNKKAEQDQNPSHLKNLPPELLGKIIAPFFSYSDKMNLATTCKKLGYPHTKLHCREYFSIDTIKKNFIPELESFVNSLKDKNGNYKSLVIMSCEINNGTIKHPKDTSVLTAGFNKLFSEIHDDAKSHISYLLYEIKNNITEDQLAELASLAIKKMPKPGTIIRLLEKIKNNITKDQLAELASLAIKKMPDSYIKLLVLTFQNNITKDQLAELASKAITKMSHDYLIQLLREGIKDNSSEEKI